MDNLVYQLMKIRMPIEVAEVDDEDFDYVAEVRLNATDGHVFMGMAILGPSPPYEYRSDQLLHVVSKE